MVDKYIYNCVNRSLVRLYLWKVNAILMGDKLTLIKYVLGILEVYLFSMFCILKGMLSDGINQVYFRLF